jgi:hypothetical protein
MSLRLRSKLLPISIETSDYSHNSSQETHIRDYRNNQIRQGKCYLLFSLADVSFEAGREQT